MHETDRNELAELRRLVEGYAAEVAKLKAAMAANLGTTPVTTIAPSAGVPVDGARDDVSAASSDRRGFLRLAAAGTLGTVGAMTVLARPAAAANNDPVLAGVAGNTATLPTVVTNTGAGGLTVSALRGVGPADSNGVTGEANGSSAAGVLGKTTTGYGVYGESDVGHSLYAGGNGRIGMLVHPALSATAGPPTSGGYLTGDLVRDHLGSLWLCVSGGSPGTWRKVAGQDTAGQIHLLPAPTRFIDSSQGRRSGVTGPVSGAFVAQIGGQTQDGNTVPAGALGIMGTLFIAPVSQGGYATVSAGDAVNPELTASTVVFPPPNGGFSTTAFFTSRLSSTGAFRVFCQRSAFVTVDVVGYLR